MKLCMIVQKGFQCFNYNIIMFENKVVQSNINVKALTMKGSFFKGILTLMKVSDTY